MLLLCLPATTKCISSQCFTCLKKWKHSCLTTIKKVNCLLKTFQKYLRLCRSDFVKGLYNNNNAKEVSTLADSLFQKIPFYSRWKWVIRSPWRLAWGAVAPKQELLITWGSPDSNLSQLNHHMHAWILVLVKKVNCFIAKIV